MLKLFVSRQYLVDGIHPGDEGHRDIADAIRIGRDELSADFVASQLCIRGAHADDRGPTSWYFRGRRSCRWRGGSTT
jgi:hypothetical protein